MLLLRRTSRGGSSRRRRPNVGCPISDYPTAFIQWDQTSLPHFGYNCKLWQGRNRRKAWNFWLLCTSNTPSHSKRREKLWTLSQCLLPAGYRHSSPGSVLSRSAARATRHRPESSITSRAYLLPPLVCVVMPLKMDLKSSGDGPVAMFLLNLLTPPDMGSLSVRFVLTTFL